MRKKRAKAKGNAAARKPPSNAEVDLRALPGLVDRSLRLPGKGAELSEAELRALRDRLQRLTTWLEGCAEAGDCASARRTLSPYGVALLRLAAWAVRVSPGHDLLAVLSSRRAAQAENVAESTTFEVVKAAGALLGAAMSAAVPQRRSLAEPSEVDLCRRLLKMQTLRAAAKQLAECLELLKSTSTEESLQAVLAVGSDGGDMCGFLWTAMVYPAAWRAWQVLVGGLSLVEAVARVACSQAVLAPLVEEFVAELRASAVMEHAARLVLDLVRVMRPPGAGGDDDEDGEEDEGVDGSPGPSISQEGRHVVEPGLLCAFWNALDGSLAAPKPPVTRRAVVAMALRLGRIALASALGCSARPAPVEPSPDDPSMVLLKETGLATMLACLNTCYVLQFEADAATGGAPMRPFRRPSWAAEAEAAWRLWVDATRRAVPLLSLRERQLLSTLGYVMTSKLTGTLCDEGAGALPAAVPPELAAPLRAGCLPALELVIRRAGEEPEGPYGDFLAALCEPPCKPFSDLLLSLLAYGEARAARSQTRTLGPLGGTTGRSPFPAFRQPPLSARSIVN
ncbi:hypothetical protein HYH03_006240 [Edaphochlamys debaryana]|uniref:Uncharacterized protein n=1 Tax=Edaphochlamys debaryana TaxID=47281 RepID=A0A836C0E3_9CHLO|nr:hypothetical protein HYH03_006240 [Edaphochlamys debaryana]|eukprot:KAG2495640.1 hypothetical protein HYH03_006240 [Edaphochlamys debaryana]